MRLLSSFFLNQISLIANFLKQHNKSDATFRQIKRELLKTANFLSSLFVGDITHLVKCRAVVLYNFFEMFLNF